MIPLGLAMQKSGLATVLVSYVVRGFAADSPWVALFLVYMVTAILTEIMRQQRHRRAAGANRHFDGALARVDPCPS